MNLFERKIATMIGGIFRHWRRRELHCFGAGAAVGLLVWLLVMVVVDNLLMLTSGQFLLGWGMLVVAGLGGGITLAYRLSMARPAADRLALMYEARVPDLHNRLINAVQFIASRKTQQDPLVQVAIAESAAALDPRAAARGVDFHPVRKALMTVVVALVVLLGYTAVRPQWVANGLSRLVHPVSPTTHLLATEPLVHPGDIELIEGDPLTVSAEVQPSLRGHVPEQVYLEYRVADLQWISAVMSPTAASSCGTGILPVETQVGSLYHTRPVRGPAATLGSAGEAPTATFADNVFAYSFQAVWHPLEYRVRAGRSLSTTYHVSVQPRPRVSELQLTVTRPEYAGGQSRALQPNVGDVSALIGSTIDLSLTASVPLSEGQLELADGTILPLQIHSEDRAQARFILQRSGSYAIRLTDRRALSNANPPRYTLTAEPDQAPAVLVTRPGRDLILAANAEFDVHIEAEDDIGLRRVTLQTRHGEGDWTNTQTFDFTPGDARRQTVTASLALADFGLEVNDVLLYRALAEDNCVPRANVGVGRTWSVAIAAADADGALLAAQARRLLDALRQLLAWQRENRAAFDLDRAVEPLRDRQQDIRELTVTTIDKERKSLRPNENIMAELVSLADGHMLQAIQLLADYGGEYKERYRLKPPIIAVLDEIIDRLEELIGRVRAALAKAEQAQQVLAELPEHEREKALANIRDLLEKLREFIPEQDQVIEDTEELARKADDLTDEDLQKLEQLKGTEDKWAEIFAESVKDIEKLTEQGFADRSIANDYKEMVEQIEAASLNLTPDLVELAVPREQSGRELAESLVEEMEMWLPNSPDYIKWIMEEPLDFPDIPMVELPDQLWDYIGDLIEDQNELNDAAEDLTSAWADSIAEGAGWEVAGGPISNFSAVGKTGNQLPDNNELSGRSGEGRSGRSQGQLVENVAKGLQGRKTPTRITNDSYEQGVVKELQQMATGGATGGGKARGAGQEGLQGQSPPPMYEDLRHMREWQKRIRQKAQRVVGQLQVVRVEIPSLEESIRLMREVEQAAAEGRYADMFRTQQMVLQNLRLAGELAAREIALRIDRAYHLPADQRRQILDAMDEPVPEEYQAAVRRYFQQLSESE
ncbi:MAG: hypothetical protein KAY37_09065 [Phycisphaerae bacterium]|nr:hypothetical protein [Phycisphaerae bacterium]